MRKALIAAGLNQIELARMASKHMPFGQKVPRDAVHKAVIRGSMPRDRDIRDAIAKTLGVRPQWLWYGDDETSVPVALEQIGQPVANFGFRPDPKGYSLIVENDSFEPVVRRGDVIYITPSYPVRVGDRVLVEQGGANHIYRLVGAADNVYRFQAPRGEIVVVKMKECARVHRIAGVVFD